MAGLRPFSPDQAALLLLSRSRNSLPVLKNGTHFSSTSTELAGAWIATCPGGTVFDRKRTEPAQFDTVAGSQRIRNLVEDGADDVFDIAEKQMRVAIGNNLHQL
jgi:hypothetical protein